MLLCPQKGDLDILVIAGMLAIDCVLCMKVQDTDLAAREAHYHATGRRDCTREDDRHQETIQDTKTIEEQASNKTI